MKTKIIEVDSSNPEVCKIQISAKVLRKGGLVAFPAETVYGLGANALNPKAVKKIFKVKGRPTKNPLIVHIADKNDVYNLVEDFPEKAEKLIKKFWPGPLTLVLKKSKIVPDIVTAGLDTVAIRMPNHKVALCLIKEAKVPVAAPSANLSGKPSPTCATHVIQDLYGKVDIIIDGGRTKVGLESTVIDITTKIPILLRPGKITLEQLKRILKKIEVHPCVKVKRTGKVVVKSPGMKYKHYAPDAKVIVVKANKSITKIQKIINEYKKSGKKVGIMTTRQNHTYNADAIKFIGNNHETIAKNLFKHLRELDEEKVDIIVVEGVKEKGLGLAIMNRLKRAASKIVNGK